MTSSTLQVLHALLADPTREKYGLELSKNSGIAHGTIYGILARLEDWGWLDNRLDYYPDRATPPRRYYRLTSDGTERARAAVDRPISARSMSSPHRTLPMKLASILRGYPDHLDRVSRSGVAVRDLQRLIVEAAGPCRRPSSSDWSRTGSILARYLERRSVAPNQAGFRATADLRVRRGPSATGSSCPSRG